MVTESMPGRAFQKQLFSPETLNQHHLPPSPEAGPKPSSHSLAAPFVALSPHPPSASLTLIFEVPSLQPMSTSVI